MSSEKPIVYLILGAANSGRREILANIIEDSYGTEDRPLVYVSESEKADPSDTKLGLVQHWKWWEGNIIAPVPKGTQVVYFLSDGKLNPIDQIEAFKLWILAQSLELARIFTIVNSSLAEKNPALLMWYDACIHFSDVVLMNKREGVANKWMSDFQARYKDQAYPCLFEFVKSSRVKNTALILEPLALRISQTFEAEDVWVVSGQTEDDEEDEEIEDGDEEEVEMVLAEDPYFTRLLGGRRVKEIPDIAKYLEII